MPNGVIFLKYHECGEVKRAATIPVDTKLVFLPIYGDHWFDVDDDINSALKDDCPGRESAVFAEMVESYAAMIENLSTYTKEPFATVNKEPLEPFFVFSDEKFYYKACPIDPEKEVCDECDINFQPPGGCDAFAGTDVYPSFGWIAVDNKEWNIGEVRTYNFGATVLYGDVEVCLEATYTLTAEGTAGKRSDAPKTMTSCGMFVSLSFTLYLMVLF